MEAGPSRATIDLDALAHNLGVIRQVSGNLPVIGVVKANGYGHGAIEVAKHLLGCGVSQLAVATVEEGVELRGAGIDAPVLVLGAGVGSHLGALVEHRLSAVVTAADHVAAIAELAEARGQVTELHLHLDTGMGRLGCNPAEAPSLVASISDRAGVYLGGVMTHLGCADEPERGETFAQLARFDEALDCLSGVPVQRHAYNSAAVFGPWSQRYDAVRPGLALYGVPPCAAAEGQLRAVLGWRCTVGGVRELPVGAAVGYGGRFVASRRTRVGILPVGYADGYPHAAEGRAHVLVEGQPAPVIGAVSMDLLTIDLTDLPSAGVGSEVTLIGDSIRAADLACWGARSVYEVLTGIGARVARRSVGGQR
jgi:alanine racemase